MPIKYSPERSESGAVGQTHEHMPVEMSKMSVLSFVVFLKGKSALTVYEHWSDIKFWSRGYYPQERTPVRLQNIYKIG